MNLTDRHSEMPDIFLASLCEAVLAMNIELFMALYFGGGGTKESLKALHIQKKVIRLITEINKYESCRQKFEENRILTVTSMF
jgi:hypothetical protein